MDALEAAAARMRELWESRACWYCQQAMGKTEALLLDGVWECHPICAPLARDQFGMTIELDADAS